jgi:hypothetical protein
MIMNKITIIAASGAWLILLLISGCTSDDRQTEFDVTILPEWTLTHEFDVTEPDNILFGNIDRLGVLSSHDIIVADQTNKQFYHFNTDGEFVATFSEEGGGPGEMDQISSFYITPDDELVVYDRGNMRFTVFEYRNGAWHHTAIHNHDDSAVSMSSIFAGPGDFIYALTSNVWGMDAINATEWHQTIHLINTSGNIIRDSVATEQVDNFLLHVMDQGFMILTIPGSVGLTSYFDVIGQRYIVSARSDEFAIRVLDTDTGNQSKFHYPIKRIEFTDAEKQDIMESVSSNFRRQMREKMPDYQRVIRSVVTDNHERIWIKISVDNERENQPNWIIMNLDGSLEGQIYIPNETTVRAVRDSRIYGIVNPTDRTPFIRAYTFGETY